tara:strand:- start:581 stop:1207 length:627 start_codon:yes stop_codon:yes gene_type:complete
MLNSINTELLEAGIDEAGRGCLMGPVYTAAVILPKEFPTNEYLGIIDSKKLTPAKRDKMRKYIEQHAVAWSVDAGSHAEVDKYNILQATLMSMHRAVEKLSITPEHLAVDGNHFVSKHSFLPTNSDDEIIPHTLMTGGDDKYRNIAAASILAKTHHDEFITNLLIKQPELKRYGLSTNKGYGTKTHMEAIRKYGITEFHRRSFKPCQL